MHKVWIKLALLLSSLLITSAVFACVGRTLYIGALETQEGKVMAEILATLINERTGTTIQIRYFNDSQGLYDALKSNEEETRADILVEDTIDAMAVLKKDLNQFPDKDFVTAKELYEKDLGIIWLNPFGYNNSRGKTGQSISAPLVRRDVLTNFPLLPRILNKLAGVITNATYNDLQNAAAKGEKPKNIAKDFLKKEKLI
jgi:osmoprotectant transport system substrate-binding protein